MKRKLTAILCLAALVLCMAGCSEKEETTTLTGMVVSVEGTVVNIMDTSNMGNFQGNWGGKLQMETTAVDLANAHISIQDGDIKAAGSISDIKVGSMLTITLNGKGVATEVLVTSSGMSGFAGNFGGFGGNFGGGKGQGNRNNTPAESNG